MQVYQRWLQVVVSCCDKMTDAGVSALAAGCGQLQSIHLWRCREVTQATVSLLCHVNFTGLNQSQKLY